MSAVAVSLSEVVAALDSELRTVDIPDYSGAVNGLQVANNGTVSRVAVGVDASLATVNAAVQAGADLLVVHHGLFWGGVQPVVGTTYTKMRALLANNIAVYSTHLPLDAHPTLGNNALLARALGLTPTRTFGRYKSVEIAVSGDSDLEASALQQRVEAVVAPYGGVVRTSIPTAGRRVHRWALITGGGASTESLREARDAGVDTFIVGEGPHHTTVEAQEEDLLLMFAGHYATETLGVQAVGAWLASRFALPWSFLHQPTGS